MTRVGIDQIMTRITLPSGTMQESVINLQRPITRVDPPQQITVDLKYRCSKGLTLKLPPLDISRGLEESKSRRVGPVMNIISYVCGL